MISSLKQSAKKHRTMRDMGKYIRKPKTTVDLAVKDVSQLYLGVRTRSRTRALQRLELLSIAAADDSPPAPNPDFLELRSRRLEKTPFVRKKSQKSRKRRAPKRGSVSRGNESPLLESSTSTEKSCSEPAALPIEPAVIPIEPVAIPIEPVALPIVPAEEEDGGFETPDEGLEIGGLEIEASLGENNMDLEARERGTRESTPSSLIMPADSVTTPGSSTMPRRPSPRAQVVHRDITPSNREMDDFFAQFNQQQRLRFIEKYNFDIENDVPLPGRYEWVKLTP